MAALAKLFLFALSCIGFWLCAAASAQAQLMVDPVILDFDRPDLTRQDMIVGNVGLRPQYLEISAAQILNPGAHPEAYLESPDPDQVGLLVAPRRIVLQPGEEKVVRVILLDQEIETDRAWRVHFKPVIGEVVTDGPVAIPLIAVKALVFARPSDPNPRLVGRRVGQMLEVSNLGNTNAVLFGGLQCPPEDSACIAIPGQRLWPGMVWSTQLPQDAPVSFQIRAANEDRKIEF